MWLGSGIRVKVLGFGLGLGLWVRIRIRVWNMRAHASVASWCECMKIPPENIVIL